MAILYFRVQADYDKVIKLREEIAKLKAELKNMDSTQSSAAFNALNEQLGKNTREMNNLIEEAAKAGAVIEGDFRKKIFDASQTVNELSESITNQRGTIQKLKNELSDLKEKYREALKQDGNTSGLEANIRSTSSKLMEQKESLFSLTQQQANARLSVKKLRDEYALYHKNAGNVVEANNLLHSSLGKFLAGFGGMMAIQAFASKVLDATGKMQQLNIALTTILQSKEKADALVSQITEFAAKTPFDLDDVAQGAKQLLAYGSTADKVVSELSMLGDVASGLQIPIGQLIYLYGTLRTQGKAMTVDIRQFAGRGIPIYEELAKVLGVSKDQVGELVTAGKVGFAEVEKAFQNMTSEGGKFANMMESSAGTWPQRMSNIGDTLFQKLNEFGNKYKEVFEFGIGTTEELTNHLDDIISAVGGLVAAYGVYKAVLIAVAAVQKANAFIENVRLISMMRKELGLATAAQQAFNLASKANIYATLLSVLAGLVTTILMFTRRTNEATVAQQALSSVNKKTSEEFSRHASVIDRLNGVLKSETSSLDQKKKALVELQTIIPNYNAKLDEEGRLIDNNTEAIKAYLTQLEKQIKLKAAQEELEELYRKKRLQEKEVQLQQSNYKTVKAQNPIGVVYGGDAGIEAQRHSLNLIADTEKALTKANDELKNTQNKIVAIEKEIEETSLSPNEDLLQSNISKEIEDVTTKIKTLKQEIEDLRNGKLKVEAGKTVESVIESKKKELQEAEKSLETLTGKSNKEEPEAEKQKKNQQKLSDDLLSLRRKNQQDEIALMQEGREKKLKQIATDFKAQEAEILKKSREFATTNKKAGIAGLNSDGLTAQQQADIDKANQLNADSRAKAESDVYKAEAQAMRDYLKEYGTFQQQRLAIAEEYAEKIKKAQSDGERKTLEKQRDVALQQVEIEAIKQSIDWGSVFGEFGTMFKEQLQPTIDKLKEIVQSDEFKSSSLQDQQALYELISKLEQSNATWDSDIFKQVSDDMVAYQSVMQNYIDAQERERQATESLTQAKRDLKKAEESGNNDGIRNAQAKVNEIQLTLNVAAEDVKYFSSEVQQATSNLQSSSTKAVDMFQGLESGLQGLASGSLEGIGQGIMQLDKLFNNNKLTEAVGNALAKGFQTLLGKNSEASKSLTEALGNAGFIGQIISAILSILDILKDGIGPIISGIIDSVLGAINGILDNILSGDFFVQIFNSIKDGIGNILNAISFGGFTTLTHKISGSNAKEVREAIDRLTSRNETLGKSIDRLTDVMDKTAGSKSISAYEQAYTYQQEQNRNTLQIAQEQAGYRGSHHSWQYYMGWTNEQIQWARKNVDKNFSGTDSLWGLTPEQMKMLLSNADIYEQINGAGKGGYGNRVMERLEAYADNAGKLDELTDKINESLMQVSFDSLRDSFLNSLMDMDKDAKSFSEDFSEYMQRALLNFSMGEMFDEDLKNWYDNLAELMKAQNGKLTEYQLNAARKDYDDLVQDAINERDQIAAITGYSGDGSKSQQSATQRGYDTMSQDTASELNGRFTALQMAGEEIKAQNIQQTETMNILSLKADSLLYVGTDIRNIADETRSILANSYLELRQISDNTGAIITPINEMNDKLEKIQRNTENL